MASFGGAPHAYRSRWRDDEDDWDQERFALSPVTPEQVALVMEDWAIWCRWDEAFRAGETTMDEHPALLVARPRHAELAPLVKRAMAIDPARQRIATGKFRLVGREHESPRIPSSRVQWQVRWAVVE